MGLDQYAFKTLEKITPVDFEYPEDHVQIKSWRKHPDLHGFMEDLYYSKGGKNREFNCNTVELTVKDLINLKTLIQVKGLAKTEGFFFGESQDEEFEYDMEFIDSAIQALDEGFHIYYDSWW